MLLQLQALLNMRTSIQRSQLEAEISTRGKITLPVLSRVYVATVISHLHDGGSRRSLLFRDLPMLLLHYI